MSLSQKGSLGRLTVVVVVVAAPEPEWFFP